MEVQRLNVVIPSVFVVPPPRPPPPPLFPGTVSAEDLKPPSDPPLPFLVPWSSHKKKKQLPLQNAPLPVEVDVTMMNKYLERHDVAEFIMAVFKAEENGFELASEVMQSLTNPFKENGSSIVWSIDPVIKQFSHEAMLGGKKLKNRHHRILRGLPWSICSFRDDDGDHKIARNLVYNGDGDAIVQIDFGHGTTAGIHAHVLVKGSLDHTPGYSEDHAFSFSTVPWPWLCVCDLRQNKNITDAIPLVLPDTIDFSDPETDGWVAISLPFEDYMGSRQGSES
jgi:hypothetical protein